MIAGPRKNQPKRSLSPIQRQRLVKITVIMVIFALLWILFAPNSGIVSLVSRHKKLDHLEQENINIDKENAATHADIKRLQNDPKFLEKEAREKYDMLKEDEQVFVLPRAQKKEEE